MPCRDKKSKYREKGILEAGSQGKKARGLLAENRVRVFPVANFLEKFAVRRQGEKAKFIDSIIANFSSAISAAELKSHKFMH